MFLHLFHTLLLGPAGRVLGDEGAAAGRVSRLASTRPNAEPPAVFWTARPSENRFTSIERPIETIAHYPVDAWLSENFWADHIHPEDRAATLAALNEARTGVRSLRYRIRAADGRVVEVYCEAAPDTTVKDDVQGYFVDVTDAALHEEALEAARRSARRACARLTRLQAHGVDAGAPGLCALDAPPRRADAPEANGHAPHGVNVAAVLRACQRELYERAASQGARLRITAAPDAPACGGDAVVVRRAVMHLLLAALDATPPGGAIVAHVARRDEGLRVVVVDEGPKPSAAQVLDAARAADDFEMALIDCAPMYAASKGASDVAQLRLRAARTLANLIGGEMTFAARDDAPVGGRATMDLPAAAVERRARAA